MIKIEVKSETVHERTIKGFTFREQMAWAHLVARDGSAEPYPRQIVVSLEDGKPAHKAGMYTLLPQSFYTDKYDHLTIGRLALTAAKA